MDKRLKYLIFILSLAAFIALCVFLETNDTIHHEVSIKCMEKSSYDLIDIAAIKKRVEKDSTITENKDSTSLRLFSVEKEISSNPYIEKAIVYQEPSGKIQIQLWEHIPLYRVVGDSIDYYMSNSGEKMPLKKGVAVNIPLINSKIKNIPHSEIKTILSAIKADSFFNEIFMGLNINRYPKGDSYGYTFTASTRLSDIQIILGDSSYIDDKIENFKALYSYLSKENKLKEYKVVNLEFTDYLVLQRKK